MGHYRHFSLATYFVAEGTARTTLEQLERDIAFFEKHLHLDKVYIEPFRGGILASDEQIELVKSVFSSHGIAVSGGLTTTLPSLPGQMPKQRLFDTFCYTDAAMREKLWEAVRRIAAHFDEFMIDDFFFTNCTCESCRKEKGAFDQAQRLMDGSWEYFRLHLMEEVSKILIATAKAVNPDIRIIIKFPNWMESFQETGYHPKAQRTLFDAIYTGTETRDPLHTDQHLPRYLSFSLMRYFEAMLPGKNGGGWFDPYDCQILEHYLEQAYLTAFSKPKEMMLFCFQSLVNTVNIAALGHKLLELDALLDHTGNCVTIPCYIPDNSQGEDNVQDYLGMAGLPIATTPYFPKDAKALLLTASSACDPKTVDQLEAYLLGGGKAIVTSGFVKATMDRGIKRLTSIRPTDRKVPVDQFFVENIRWRGLVFPQSIKPIMMPVLTFRNNATWAYVKGVRGEESFGLLLNDTYGSGEMLTLCVPEAFSDIRHLPREVLTRIRKACAINGIYLEGPGEIGLFQYDNDTVILYPFAAHAAQDADVLLHVAGQAQKLHDPIQGMDILPLYRYEDTTVFPLRAKVGLFRLYQIIR